VSGRATLAKENADVFRSISLQMIVVVVAGAFNRCFLIRRIDVSGAER